MSDRTWADYAAECESMAEYLESRGEHSRAYRFKAADARRAHESQTLQESTGLAHCFCHLRPFTECSLNPQNRAYHR